MTGFCNLHNKAFPLLGANPAEIIHGYRPPQGPLKRTKIDSPKRLYEACMRDPERLLNSRSGRIHFFPCVPAWSTVAFGGFQARGGFLVSAEMVKGKVTFVRITARRDGLCRFKNPWSDATPAVVNRATGQPVPCEMAPDDFASFRAAKEITYELTRQ